MNSVKPWGTEIFDTEEAVVVQALHMHIRESGCRYEDAADRTIEISFDELGATSDSGDIWVALTSLLMLKDVKQHLVLEKLRCLDVKRNANRWAGTENEERHTILASLIRDLKP